MRRRQAGRQAGSSPRCAALRCAASEGGRESHSNRPTDRSIDRLPRLVELPACGLGLVVVVVVVKVVVGRWLAPLALTAPSLLELACWHSGRQQAVVPAGSSSSCWLLAGQLTPSELLLLGGTAGWLGS